MFGVSRPIVREALLRLRADGLLHARPGAGTFVQSRPAERIVSFASTADVAGYLRALEARLPLEGAAARFAAERRTAEELARIERAHETFVRALRGHDGALPSDLAFHAKIAEAAHNDLFVAMLAALRQEVEGFMRVSLGLTRTGSRERARRVGEEHARIVEAIRAQDGEAAQLAMQYHITQARIRVLDRTRDT
jgi:GntR family transcriptional repressor for pyruvate dehydrogenase complex